MNIEEYISSGILEAYVLGEVSAVERKELEQLLTEHAMLREELKVVEETMEAFALQTAIAPSARVKEKLMKSIDEKAETKVIPLRTNWWKYVAAASVSIALITSYLAFNYHNRWKETTLAMNNLLAQNQQIAQDYSTVNQKLDKIQGDFSIIENTSFDKVVMAGTANAPEALATVYWNSGTEEVYLSIQQLKQIASDNQFQLWAIVDGKPVDAGVFDSTFDGLLKMKMIKGATAFAVTIEPRGGKPAPTMETMQVMGAIKAG